MPLVTVGERSQTPYPGRSRNPVGATRAATFHFLNPVFGVAIASLLLGEKLGPQDIVGVLIVTGGILAVQLSRQPGRAAKVAAKPAE